MDIEEQVCQFFFAKKRWDVKQQIVPVRFRFPTTVSSNNRDNELFKRLTSMGRRPSIQDYEENGFF
jgi:hypothetical protein